VNVLATVTERPAYWPDHVPANLFWDNDIGEYAASFDDPFVGISELHKGPELIWARSARRGRPGWVPTSYELINEIFMDHTTFSNFDNIGAGSMLGVDWVLIPLEVDPPTHMAYRQLLQPSFNPSAINRYEAMIRRIAQELIGKFQDKDSCEFVGEFAALFPSYVFLELFGLPRDLLPQFYEWEHAFTRSSDPEVRLGGLRATVGFLEEYLEQRRNEPPRDDLVSVILNGTVKGRPLTPGEVMGITFTLYSGGLDTVVSSLGWHIRHLAMDQDLQTRLRNNPEHIPAAVDELLRCYGVVATMRTVAKDTVFHGVTMKKGDYLLMPGFLASRDPRQYTDPHRVDPDRKARHLTLATGVHNCLGGHLAKREIKIVLEELLSRVARFGLLEGGRQEWDTTGVWAMTHLDLALKR
jgi:cytochrome P450